MIEKPKYLYGLSKAIFNRIDNELYEPKIKFEFFKNSNNIYYFGIANKYFDISEPGYLPIYIKEEDIVDFGYGIKILRKYK